jgi:hypothetical protein
MIQTIIVAFVFIAAVVYVGNLVYKAFQSKSSCSSGCGKCGAVDFDKINKQLTEKGF